MNETNDLDLDASREWIAPRLIVLNVGATAGGANPMSQEGSGGSGGGDYPLACRGRASTEAVSKHPSEHAATLDRLPLDTFFTADPDRRPTAPRANLLRTTASNASRRAPFAQRNQGKPFGDPSGFLPDPQRRPVPDRASRNEQRRRTPGSFRPPGS